MTNFARLMDVGMNNASFLKANH